MYLMQIHIIIIKEYFGANRVVMINKQSTNSVALKSKRNVFYYFRKL